MFSNQTTLNFNWIPVHYIIIFICISSTNFCCQGQGAFLTAILSMVGLLNLQPFIQYHPASHSYTSSYSLWSCQAQLNVEHCEGFESRHTGEMVLNALAFFKEYWTDSAPHSYNIVGLTMDEGQKSIKINRSEPEISSYLKAAYTAMQLNAQWKVWLEMWACYASCG